MRLLLSRWTAAGLSPELLRDKERRNLLLGPPRNFIAAPVERAMMQPAQRNRELVTHPAAERCALGKAEMMRVRRASAAKEARLQSHEPEVIAVAVAPRFAYCQGGFV